MSDEIEYKQYIGQWQQWFAWRPVTTIQGKRVWLKLIYRRSYSAISGNGYDYATVFDLLQKDLSYPYRY